MNSVKFMIAVCKQKIQNKKVVIQLLKSSSHGTYTPSPNYPLVCLYCISKCKVKQENMLAAVASTHRNKKLWCNLQLKVEYNFYFHMEAKNNHRQVNRLGWEEGSPLEFFARTTCPTHYCFTPAENHTVRKWKIEMLRQISST